MKDQPKLLVEPGTLTPAEQKVYVKMERWMTSAIRTPADAQRIHDKIGVCMDRITGDRPPYDLRDPNEVLFNLWVAADYYKGDACGYARDSLRHAARQACKPRSR